MDPRDGAILAMGSQPGFDASVFARPFTETTWKDLTSQATGAPLLNRATESAYPIGSTFKPITALAALEGGLICPTEKIFDNGHYELGPQKYQNAKGASFGSIDISDALKVSSDVFFYKLGERANAKGRVIQRWAKRLGFGRKTGIDVPSEAAGLVPDSAWRNGAYARYSECVEEGGAATRRWPRSTSAAASSAVDDGRQRQPRRRPGRPAGDAAAGRGRLLGARQRRHDRAPAPRQGDRGRQRRHGPGDPHQAAAQDQDRPARPRGRARGPAPRRERAGRHLGRRLQGLPKYKVYGKTGTVERQPNPDQAGTRASSRTAASRSWSS